MVFHVFFLPKFFNLCTLLSVPFSLGVLHVKTLTCSEVAAEYNNSAYLHLNVNLNCVGCWRGRYIQQLCAAVCVCVCHRWGSEILKVNAAIFFSSSLVISIYQIRFFIYFMSCDKFFTCVTGQQLLMVVCVCVCVSPPLLSVCGRYPHLLVRRWEREREGGGGDFVFLK